MLPYSDPPKVSSNQEGGFGAGDRRPRMQAGRRPRQIEPWAEAGAGADPAGRGSWPVFRGRAA